VRRVRGHRGQPARLGPARRRASGAARRGRLRLRPGAAAGAGAFGAAVGLLVGLALALSAWVGGDRLLLASAGARAASREAYPQLTNVVEEVAIAAGLPSPRVYVIEDPAPNAFATGRSPERAALAVTRGLLDRLDRAELQGIVAHEIGHIQNRDTLFMTLAAALAGALVLLADVAWRATVLGGRRGSGRDRGGSAPIILVALLLAVVAAPLGRLLRMAASREREYLADATAALLTRYPEGLASALEKIAGAPSRLAVNDAVAPLCVVNPRQAEADRPGCPAGLVASHPPTARRVAVLRAMGTGASYAAYERAYGQVVGRNLPPPGARAAPGTGRAAAKIGRMP
jgi:heat shock protein HtpX